MAAHTVHVSYQRNNAPPFTYSPGNGNVDVTETGTITFDRAGGSWTFQGINITPASNNFTVTSLNDDQIVITDADTSPGTYNYCITIQTSDGTAVSDPQIINKT
ncbi:MAG TPA: DP-EP family protein [Gemmatimonadaceae bacterium]|nr:DP-EP family protein [Gemmatimonadaceae bacterium]